jgi:hypothetical protein
MLSARLVQLIEDHWEPLTRRILLIIRADPRLRHLQTLSESDLHDRIGLVCKNLGRWLAAGDDEHLAAEFEALGGQRHREAVPIDEVVHATHLIKHRLLDFVRDQGIAQTSVELYAQEELEHRVGLFFDAAVYHLVRGYEGALREATAAAQSSETVKKRPGLYRQALREAMVATAEPSRPPGSGKH